MAKCAGKSFDHDDDDDRFDELTVLLFYQNHGAEFPTWALAMRVVGATRPPWSLVELGPVVGELGRRGPGTTSAKWAETSGKYVYQYGVASVRSQASTPRFAPWWLR